MLHADLKRPHELTFSEVALWRVMLSGSPGLQNPLLGPEFAQAVGSVRDDAWVAVLKRDGGPVGFLAHHRAPGGYARPIGAPFSDYHAVISRQGEALALGDVLGAAGLRKLRFCAALDGEGAFAPSTEATHLAYPIDLRRTGAEEHLEALRLHNPKHFKRMRQLLNKAERELGPLELIAGDPDREALERAFAWKSAQLRRSGLYDVLKPRWVRSLMDQLFAQQGESFGALHLVLRAGGRQIASSFGVRQGRRFHSWVATFDPSLAEYAPGRVLHFKGIAEMPAMGLDLWDLGPHHGEWKRRFVLEPVPVLEGLAEAHASAVRRPAPAVAPPLGSVLAKIAGRLEHIAAAEPTVSGRMSGLMDAALNGHRRMAAAGAPAEA